MSGPLVVVATVLIVAALALVVVGVLAALRRLPRNRVIGVRTSWTMARLDAFRRANRVAAPAFVAAGTVGVAGGVAGLVAPTTLAGVTLVAVGVVGLVALLGVGGAMGARYAAADRAETLEAERRPAAPCTLGDTPGDDTAGGTTPTAHDAPGAADDGCATTAGACGGACSICPRAGASGPA